MKTAYTYDDNGLYIGATECRLDPLELELNQKEVFLLPGNATFEEPPIFNFKTERLIRNNGWVVEAIPVPGPGVEPEYTATLQEINRADIDYIAIMLGVEL